MSQTTMNKAIESPMFIVAVGAERAEMKIHSNILAGASRTLGALVNGNMREAHERKSEWIDVDKETFIRFRQYLYYADYNMPTFAVRRTPDDRGNEKSQRAEIAALNEYEGWNWPTISWMNIPTLDQYRWDSNARADYAWFRDEIRQQPIRGAKLADDLVDEYPSPRPILMGLQRQSRLRLVPR
ncbi:unnamed protein product [Penicillium salamii]|uniref:BTB domain-containing protein n=1 Tax=Penicillium salamii TaxID=1612424 RepID=A0A9W4JVW8_9EURO|nr:unnamed protein product [Penicillium salamii]CAG8395574.1 unnamed protein product [Penicillium salamii]CAG8414745.1 unnamed protein product [Penicillium salamii]CAG8419978.1 unnamed protein product [Penicillium salamii]